MTGLNERLAALRHAIRGEFPQQQYDGNVTEFDDSLSDPEYADDRELHDELKGKDWTAIKQELLDNMPDGYVRLTYPAFGCFLAAWLMRSLDKFDDENEVRDFVVYAFSPKHDMVPDTTYFIVDRLRSLTQPQRMVIRSLLAEFSEHDPSDFQRDLALRAVSTHCPDQSVTRFVNHPELVCFALLAMSLGNR